MTSTLCDTCGKGARLAAVKLENDRLRELVRGECRDVSKRRATMTCSVCGATVKFGFDADGEPTITVDGFAEVPKYCPNCGRKVV